MRRIGRPEGADRREEEEVEQKNAASDVEIATQRCDTARRRERSSKQESATVVGFVTPSQK